jgi:hypothetical protein
MGEPEPAHDNEGYHGFEEYEDRVCICEHEDKKHHGRVGFCNCFGCPCPRFRLGEKVTYADHS